MGKITGNQQDEMQLIRGLKRGHEYAFTCIFNLYFQTLYQYSVAFLKSEHDAEDVVQEVFIRLWLNRENITAENSLKSFLFTATRNLLITRFNQRLNAPAFEDYLDYCNSLGREDNSRLEYEEFMTRLDRCISELPHHQQNVVRMSKIEQLGNKEIADRLGINEQSVKNSLSLGLRHVRSRMAIPMALLMLIFS